MATVATNIKKGQCIKHNGEPGIVLDTDHRTPGKGNAIMLATVRSITTGKTKQIRFASSEKVDLLSIDRQKLEFSYADPSGFFFMDTQTYETVEIPKELLAEGEDMLVENMACEVLFLEGNPVSVELPPSVELKVTEAAEGLKGDTANNPQKPITLETGKVIQGPLFIKEGDVLKIDTRTGKYMSRV